MKKNKVSNDDQMFSKKETTDVMVDDVGILGAGGYVPKRFYKWHHGLFPGGKESRWSRITPKPLSCLAR